MNHKGKRSDLDHKAALMEAIRQNDIAKVVSLIENGVDIEPLGTLWLDSHLNGQSTWVTSSLSKS